MRALGRSRSTLLAAALLAAAVLPAALLAQAPPQPGAETGLRVTVTDRSTGTPLQGAQVAIDRRTRARADARGQASFPTAAPRTYNVQVSMPGWAAETREVTLQAGAAQHVEFALTPNVVPLAPVTATASPEVRHPSLQGFYERAASNARGFYFTRADLDRMKPSQFSDVFRQIPGAQMIPSTRPGFYTVRFTRATQTPTNPRCMPRYYLDGIPTPVEIPDMEFKPDEIEGVEVYTGAAVPPQFNGGHSGCGVIIVWSRERR